MKKLFCSIVLLVCFLICSAGDFSTPTNTSTLEQQTMCFSKDYGEHRTISLMLWGQSTGMGATLEIVNMAESPKPTEISMEYEINGGNSLYLLVDGKRFQLVVLRNDTAYVYSLPEEELVMALPRKM